MAIYSCNICGKPVSDKAAACPHCGAPIEDAIPQLSKDKAPAPAKPQPEPARPVQPVQPESPAQPTAQEPKKSKLPLVLAIIAGVAVLVAAVIFLGGKKDGDAVSHEASACEATDTYEAERAGIVNSEESGDDIEALKQKSIQYCSQGKLAKANELRQKVVDYFNTHYPNASEEEEYKFFSFDYQAENAYYAYLNDRSSFAWLSEREVTEQDLADYSKDELRILRNTIFALHGYIFNSEELRDHFGTLEWYSPTTHDVSLTELEKRNVDFIKRHE